MVGNLMYIYVLINEYIAMHVKWSKINETLMCYLNKQNTEPLLDYEQSILFGAY